MKLKPTTKQFLLSAGFAAAVMAAFLARGIWQIVRLTGGDRAADLQAMLVEGAFFGGILVLGVAFAWIRLLRDRKERAGRAPPLSLD